MPQANQYYEAERILDERIQGEATSYLIKWKGMDQSGKPWEPTWEPASHCTPPLIASWEQYNRAAKRKLRSPNTPSSPSNNSSKNSPNKRERKLQKIAGGFNYGTPPGNIVGSEDSPMLIDSDDDFLRNSARNSISLSKLKQVDGHSSVDAISTIKNIKIQRQLLHPYQILLPVPLSKLQQIAYRKTLDKPQLFKYLAETNLSTPPELNSIIVQTKDHLLKIVNHLSLLLSSIPGCQGSNISYQTFEKTGKLMMMYNLLNGLRNYELTLGIAIPQGPIMNGIIKDFMNKHKLNYTVLNETANKKLLKETSQSDDKLLCIVFTTPLPKMSEEELPQFDLVIAYDTSFNPKKHLLNTKTNENIPTIRLVTKNTLEHALNYQMLQKQDNFLFSDLSLFEIKRILTFGLLKKNQIIEAGCELSKFDIQGTCDKVFQWINDGMIRNLSFGMEAAVEKVWGKTIPPEHVTFDRSRLVERKDLVSTKAEKRVSEVSDEGNLKRRKDKEVVQNEDDPSQKKKKLKVVEEPSVEASISSVSSRNSSRTLSLTTLTSTSTSTPTILSPSEPLTESPIEQISPMSLNKPKQTQSQRNSKDDSPRDSRRSSLKDSSRDSYNKSRESTLDNSTITTTSPKNSIRENSNNNRMFSKDSINKNVRSNSKDSNKINKPEQNLEEATLEWKQKHSDLLAQFRLQDEKIENLTQEKDKYRKMTNELSSDLAKTRTQLGELQVKRKRSLLEVQSIELDKLRMEMANVALENSRLKTDFESKEQEINKFRKEIETLKNNSKMMKTKIKNLEIENTILNTQSTSSGKKRGESLEDKVQQLEDEKAALKLQCKLQEQQLRFAEDDQKYHRDITELLLQIKGKTKKEMEELYLAKKNGTSPKSSPSSSISNSSVNSNVGEKNSKSSPSNNNSNERISNETDTSSSIQKGSSTNNTTDASSYFGYYSSNFEDVSRPTLSRFKGTKTFTCDWDNCKKEFGNKEELREHVKFGHNLDPSCTIVID